MPPDDPKRRSHPSFGTLAGLPVAERVGILEREMADMRIRHDSQGTMLAALHEKMGAQPDAFGKGGSGVMASLDILVRRSELAELERTKRSAAEALAQAEEVKAAVSQKHMLPRWLASTLIALLGVSIGVAAFAQKSCDARAASPSEMRKP